MRLLHTSDWHVGRTIRGRSRIDEHRQVLTEIVEIAAREAVDAVVIGGDQHDVKNPSADAEAVVTDIHLMLADLGVPIIEIAGNHDSAARSNAIAPLLARAGLHVLSHPAEAHDGGVLRVDVGSGTVAFGLLPWVTKADAVDSAAVRDGRVGEAYAGHVEALAGRLAAAADSQGDRQVLVTHLTASGATAGHGELEVATLSDYWVDPTKLGRWDVQLYGHIHRPQPVSNPDVGVHGRYAGAPLLLDFGETAYQPQVNIVDLSDHVPTFTPIELVTPKRLTTINGAAEDIIDGRHDQLADDIDYLRVKLSASPSAGQTDAIMERFDGRCVDVIAPPRRRATTAPSTRAGRSARQLFIDYLSDVGTSDVDQRLILDAVDDLDTAAFQAARTADAA